MKSTTNDVETAARQVGPVKAKEILTGVTKKDSRDSDYYLKSIASDKGLSQLIKQSRHPLVLFYPGDRSGNAHIVFPPSPFVSRRGYQQSITDVSLFWETEKKYVFHSNQYRGPKTECSYAEVSTQDGIALLKRMIATFQKMNNPAKVLELTTYLDSIENPTL